MLFCLLSFEYSLTSLAKRKWKNLLTSPIIRAQIMEAKNDPKKIGAQAEERVARLASGFGNVRRATLDEDCGGGKTDVVIDYIPVQVSAQPKSKAQRQKLERLGVRNIAAGTSYSDEQVLSQISNIFNK